VQLGDGRTHEVGVEEAALSSMGNVLELARRFGGEEELAAAVRDLQVRLYAA
jgi:hypothetical protein